MIWELEFLRFIGPDQGAEIREAILAEKPLLPPALERPWRCWHDLENDRAWTSDLIGGAMGKIRGVSRPCGIAWSALALWCQVNAVTQEDAPWLIAQVRALDAVFLQHKNERITASIAQFMKG
ncbi:phage tail assembly chaperone [Asaia krungthepensis]|uniref:Uncharacterized protein n=1 Tax=Asaia krungthepensis NRIC 0535 TaxID=1307925 RepID=A0ABQ0Q396_9PROT|nr:hypothetical protein [Asaia krungthepensis]GBQ89275.1 hypothetical protein AA0535_1753 [Asaia krungthepensis NRIC 0535]